MNVKASGFLSKNPTKALSLCLFAPQSVSEMKDSMYMGHSDKICKICVQV